MQVRHGEGVAIRTDPEPCVVTREGGGEASVGEHIGQPWSRESKIVSGADVVEITEGEMDGSVIASARPTRRGRRPWHVRTLFVRESGDLGSGPRRNTVGPHREDEESKPMMHEPEKSDSAVVATKPANKAGQPVAGLVERRAGTGRNADQQSTYGHRTGEACHRRWVACGKQQRYAACRQILPVGAGCLNWARPDLCGGRPVMAVPTANTASASLHR